MRANSFRLIEEAIGLASNEVSLVCLGSYDPNQRLENASIESKP